MATITQSVYIAGDIAYVSGTVNGVSYTWTLTGDHTWSAIVPEASDGVYQIALTAIDTAGNEISVQTTAYYGLHLITDRKPGTHYNASDLNRVGAAVQYLAARLHDNGYDVDTAPKTDWTRLDRPAVTQMVRYLGDVQRIRDGFHGVQALPESMRKIGWRDANNIEKALAEVDELLTRMIAATVVQCGILHTGGIV